MACFEQRISEPHTDWLRANDIYVIWDADAGFNGTDAAKEELKGHLGF